MSELNICPNCTGAGGDNNTWTCGMCGGTGGVPTASADAEPVAWLYTHPGAKPLLRHSRFPMSVPGWTETPLYTEAQMQARADAARREALDRIAALEAKLAEKDALLRECGEALGPFAENIECIAFLEAADGDLVDRPPFSAGDYRKAATTLAKIKDATDAD